MKLSKVIQLIPIDEQFQKSSSHHNILSQLPTNWYSPSNSLRNRISMPIYPTSHHFDSANQRNETRRRNRHVAAAGCWMKPAQISLGIPLTLRKENKPTPSPSKTHSLKPMAIIIVSLLPGNSLKMTLMELDGERGRAMAKLFQKWAPILQNAKKKGSHFGWKMLISAKPGTNPFGCFVSFLWFSPPEKQLSMNKFALKTIAIARPTMRNCSPKAKPFRFGGGTGS